VHVEQRAVGVEDDGLEASGGRSRSGHEIFLEGILAPRFMRKKYRID